VQRDLEIRSLFYLPPEPWREEKNQTAREKCKQSNVA
jgi:hypothetical protein